MSQIKYLPCAQEIKREKESLDGGHSDVNGNGPKKTTFFPFFHSTLEKGKDEEEICSREQMQNWFC